MPKFQSNAITFGYEEVEVCPLVECVGPVFSSPIFFQHVGDGECHWGWRSSGCRGPGSLHLRLVVRLMPADVGLVPGDQDQHRHHQWIRSADANSKLCPHRHLLARMPWHVTLVLLDFELISRTSSRASDTQWEGLGEISDSGFKDI